MLCCEESMVLAYRFQRSFWRSFLRQAYFLTGENTAASTG
jgi:hypothetical protein